MSPAFAASVLFSGRQRYYSPVQMSMSCDTAMHLLTSLTTSPAILADAKAPLFQPGTRLFRLQSADSLQLLRGKEDMETHGIRRGDCCLFPSNSGVYHLRDFAAAWWLRQLFTAAASLCGAKISRYDLHHAHWFIAPKHSGLLFHAREYPKLSDEFPYHLGYCQHRSELTLYPGEMSRRNVLYVFGDTQMYLLDAVRLTAPELISAYTVNEELFGKRIADIYSCSYHSAGDSTNRYTCESVKDLRIAPLVSHEQRDHVV